MNFKHKFTTILILSLLTIAFAISPANASDDPDTFQVYGILVEGAFPDPPGPGDWIIDEVTFTADNETKFETDHGEFVAGTCVEVKYFTSEGINYAKEIETEYDYKCSGESTTYNETYGVVISFPDPDLVGQWKIGEDILYTADEDTKFEQEHGAFFVGGCVEVKYIEDGSTRKAIEIETESSDHCDGEAQDKFYGLIELPIPDLTDYNSLWYIGGMQFKFNADTNLDQNHDEFAENVCVEVKYSVDAENNKIATKIKSKDAHHCSKGSFTRIVYGFVDSFPEDFYGTWVINKNSYVASPSTQFKESSRKFSNGQCVKVKYYTLGDVNHATEIKTEKEKKCDGSSEGLPGDNKLYATIDSFPLSEYPGGIPYVGPWIIGGISFDATPATEFEQDHGYFAVGVCVEASYTTSDDGWNSLIKVATQEAYKCENNGDDYPSALVFTSYGGVVSMPENVDPTDLTGDWKIGGASYIAGDFTNFAQEFGDFGIGAYVKVKYVLVTYNDKELARLALTIETHVEPGAGLIEVQGILTSHDSSDVLNDWVVDGLTYAADSAIEVGINGQDPKVGEKVLLNTYEINGVQYVTSVQAPYALFQPMILH
jgi:hypothetical protein